MTVASEVAAGPRHGRSQGNEDDSTNKQSVIKEMLTPAVHKFLLLNFNKSVHFPTANKIKFY